MKPLNVTLVAGLLALAAVLGTIAAGKTVSLGATHRRSADAALTAQTRQLNAYAASLRRALAARPPALPAVPKTPPPVAAVQAAQQAPGSVVYRRPAPIVVVKHTHHGDDGGEHADGEGGGGND